MKPERINKMFKIHQDEEYGAVLTVHDLNVADELDDFFTETCYVFYNIRPSTEHTEFFFGQASSVEKVEELIAAYKLKGSESTS